MHNVIVITTKKAKLLNCEFRKNEICMVSCCCQANFLMLVHSLFTLLCWFSHAEISCNLGYTISGGSRRYFGARGKQSSGAPLDIFIPTSGGLRQVGMYQPTSGASIKLECICCKINTKFLPTNIVHHMGHRLEKNNISLCACFFSSYVDQSVQRPIKYIENFLFIIKINELLKTVSKNLRKIYRKFLI